MGTAQLNETALGDIIVLVPPPGVVATFEKDRLYSTWMLVILVVLYILALSAFAIRVYTKLRIMRSWGTEDYIFVLVMGMYLSFMGIVTKTISVGAWHEWNIRLKQAHFFLYWYRLVGVYYEFVIAAIKVVIVLEFIRIFCARKKGGLWKACIALIVISCVSGALCGLLEAFHCLPFDKQFYGLKLIDPTYGHCFDIDTARIVFSATLVMQDLALFILPQYVIWKLQMSLKKKIGVSILFGFGLAGCVASSIRLYFTVMVRIGTDDLWNLLLLGVCITIEATCGIVVAAMPVSPRFVQHMRETKTTASCLSTLVGSAQSFIWRKSKRMETSSAATATSTQDFGPLHQPPDPEQGAPLSTTNTSAGRTQTTVGSDDIAVETIPLTNRSVISKTTQWNVESYERHDLEASGAINWLRLPGDSDSDETEFTGTARRERWPSQ